MALQSVLSSQSVAPRLLTVAIDGPAGAGKSTVARRLALEMGATYIDTGAMYRAVAWSVLDHGVSPDDADAVTHRANLVEIQLEPHADTGVTRVFVDGQEVTGELRTPEISKITSPLSAIPGVRHRLVEMQRALGERGNVVMEGRDIGTVVFPNADVKVFLTASLRQRALRRQSELAERGISVTFEELEQDIAERDARDGSRDVAPMVPAADAIILDSDTMDIDSVVARLLQICREASSADA